MRASFLLKMMSSCYSVPRRFPETKFIARLEYRGIEPLITVNRLKINVVNTRCEGSCSIAMKYNGLANATPRVNAHHTHSTSEGLHGRTG